MLKTAKSILAILVKDFNRKKEFEAEILIKTFAMTPLQIFLNFHVKNQQYMINIVDRIKCNPQYERVKKYFPVKQSKPFLTNFMGALK